MAMIEMCGNDWMVKKMQQIPKGFLKTYIWNYDL